ncbi:MAG: hypothetical protein HND53_11975 [Proteobacteria bacterium]|nr:hypothetical protein [Pseudomonadota bacterium]NOG61211.1 hypothetical protein [Pseudomonadota bacterium]
MSIKRNNKNIALILFVLTFSLTHVHAEPAVSELNAKVEGLGGVIDGDGTGAVAGSLAIPLTKSFGLQLDALGGTTDGNGLVGYGGHLFWRHPEQGLIGGTIARSGRGGHYVNRYGGEGEYYADRWTLAVTAGTQTGFLGSTGYGSIAAKYYINDNLMIDLSDSGFSDSRVGQIGIEWQPQTQFEGLSLFAVGGIGSDDLDYGLAGVRLYFGAGDKSLKRRHREDDPINSLMGAAAGLNKAISKQQTTNNTCVVIFDGFGIPLNTCP